MAKDRYYFSHDSNARHDEKILALRLKHGWAGYGIFWAVIEKMRENADYMCIKDYNLIAFDLRTDASQIKSIIEDFGLFVFTDDGKYFYSERLMDSMQLVEEKSSKARDSALERWKKIKRECEVNTVALNPQSDVYTSKVKESKVNETTTPNGVVLPSSIPSIKKTDEKGEWKEFLKTFDSLGEESSESDKQRIQRTELKKFIETKKPSIAEPYFTAYRLFAFKEGLPVPETLSESRRKKFKVRIKEPPFEFYKILEGIHNSKFCRGDNNRNWKVDWDWIFENDSNYLKILENKF